jgi:hypothetical protein
MQDTDESPGELPRQPHVLQLHAEDNVAVALDNVEPGLVDILGPAIGQRIRVTEDVGQGHKIALRPIVEGKAVVKCGVTIGFATSQIAAGAWVHTHNCRSGLDERSHTLDPHSGAPTDTEYV